VYEAARLLHSEAATPNAIGRGRSDVAAKCSYSGSNIYSFGMDVVKNGITPRLFDFGLPHIYVAFIKCTYVYDLPPYVISLHSCCGSLVIDARRIVLQKKFS
jgi:hypothetical protein